VGLDEEEVELDEEEAALVTAAPVGATSHQRAPNAVLPWPVVVPELGSPEK